MGWRLAGRVPGHIGRGLDVGVAGELLQQVGFGLRIGQRQVHDVHRQQVGFTGIEAALEHLQHGDVGGADAQGLDRQLAQGTDRMRRGQAVFIGLGSCIGRATHFNRQGRKREFEFGDSDHGHLCGLWLSSKKR